MRTIYFFKGLPASGKSTRRREMLVDPALQPIGYTNKDEIRKKLVGKGQWSKSIEKDVERQETEEVKRLCSLYCNVIVDNTHGHPKHEARYRDIAKQYGHEFVIVNFDTPVEECIQRDRTRGEDAVGESVIRRMWKQFFRPQPEVYAPDRSLPPAIIVDLDGTLATAVDRSWYEYSKADTDLVVEPVREVVQATLDAGVIEHLIFLTGRDEGEGRAVALKWLETKARFPVDSERVHLFMKAAGDRRADTITKLETFEKHIRPFYRVLFVLEDRSRVVDMWRQKGLACFQVAEKDD